jgi:hypothetical protein
MIRTYLFINAALYLLLSAWCVISPVSTAAFIGFATTSAAGQSEWLAVYGGLQGALGIFFLHAGLRKLHQSSAILLACYLYTGLVALRLLSVYHTGFAVLGNAKITLGLEVALACGAYLCWWFSQRNSRNTQRAS